MKKYANLIHLSEGFVLSALLCFFLFFMRRGDDLFFPLTIGFSAYAFAFLLLMIYIDGDKPERGKCKLIPLERSDLAFYALLVQCALAAGRATAHNLGEISISAAATLYSIPIVIELMLILIPAPKEAPPPAPSNERSDLKAKSLRYYAAQLRKLIEKCEFESLSAVMEQTADLLCRIDPAYSVQLDALENDVSHKCVKLENALLTHNTPQLALLEREFSATVELIGKRVAHYKYCLLDEGFYHVDDEIAMGQIDLLLDKLGLEYEEDLPSLNQPFADEFFYLKALRFASEEYAALLASYNDRIVEKLEQNARAKVARARRRQSVLLKIGHAFTAFILIAIVSITLFWHLSLQPGGLMLAENEDGTLTVTGYNPFYGDELELPARVKGKQITIIGKNALMGSSLRKLVLPEGVVTVDYQAVSDCYSLETLVLPKSLTNIGNYTFYANRSLSKIYYRGSEEDWASVKIGNLGNDDFKEIEVVFDYNG